jgi:hypothetical protein
MKRWWLILIFIALIGCHGIGIHSSAEKELINEELSQIKLNPSNSKYVTELYMNLERLLPPHMGEKYILNIDINFSSNPLLISKNSDILRENVAATVSYDLKLIEHNQLNGLKITDSKNNPNQPTSIHKGKLILRSSHDTIDAPYATHVETEQMSRNLAAQAAEEIYKRLFLHFHHHLTKRNS